MDSGKNESAGASRPQRFGTLAAARGRRRRHSLPTKGRAEHHAAASVTSASVGKRPVCFLEKRSLPSTVISNTPLLPLIKST